VDLQELLQRRRVVRNYLPEPIDPKALERILGVIRKAPSAGYAQGQKLIVITEPETRRSLGEIFGGGNYDDPNFTRWVTTAPVQIVVCAVEDDYHERYRQPDRLIDGREIEWPTPYWWVDAGGVALLLCLAALDEGLAAGLYGPPPKHMDSFRELLGIPDGVEVASVVTIGHPAEPPTIDTSSRVTWPRKPLDELVHRERWA
jgi:FMN reductase [NAD(P)H]